MQHATDHMMPKVTLEARQEHARAKLRSSIQGRDALVESSIQRGLKDGAFDGLHGAGKPLAQREYNPYEEMAGMSVAHRVLKNAGAAPAWVEHGRSIRRAHASARFRLEDAWLAVRYGSALAAATQPSRPIGDEQCPLAARWAAALHDFEGELDAVNKQIRTYNLIAPGSATHLMRLDAEAELARALLDFENGTAAQRDESDARRRQRIAAARRQAARRPPHVSPFSMGATFALKDAEIPSLFSALSDVLGGLLRPQRPATR